MRDARPESRRSARPVGVTVQCRRCSPRPDRLGAPDGATRPGPGRDAPAASRLAVPRAIDSGRVRPSRSWSGRTCCAPLLRGGARSGYGCATALLPRDPVDHRGVDRDRCAGGWLDRMGVRTGGWSRPTPSTIAVPTAMAAGLGLVDLARGPGAGMAGFDGDPARILEGLPRPPGRDPIPRLAGAAGLPRWISCCGWRFWSASRG